MELAFRPMYLGDTEFEIVTLPESFKYFGQSLHIYMSMKMVF